MTNDESVSRMAHAATFPDAEPRRPRRRVSLASALFLVACVACGFFVAALLSLLFYETLAQPIGLLLAIAGLAWVLTAVALYRLGCARACDRAIVMGGGLVSTLMCSMMFLE